MFKIEQIPNGRYVVYRYLDRKRTVPTFLLAKTIFVKEWVALDSDGDAVEHYSFRKEFYTMEEAEKFIARIKNPITKLIG